MNNDQARELRKYYACKNNLDANEISDLHLMGLIQNEPKQFRNIKAEIEHVVNKDIPAYKLELNFVLIEDKLYRFNVADSRIRDVETCTLTAEERIASLSEVSTV